MFHYFVALEKRAAVETLQVLVLAIFWSLIVSFCDLVAERRRGLVP